MKMKGFYKILWFISLVFATVVRSSEITAGMLGIPPQEEKYFLSERIKCKDGSKVFPRNRLNDDFCDCPDGTDEPGTSACPEGKFYCINAGHVPLLLFSSRVNDGICDCCDGSDEYAGKVKCPNTCWEAGKVTREKLKKKLSTYKEGFTIRKQEIERSKQMITKDKSELESLKQEEKKLKEVVENLKANKEAIEKVEEQERLEREKEEQRKRDAEKQAKDQETLQSEESLSQDSQPVSEDESESPEQALPLENQNVAEESDHEAHGENVHNKDSLDIAEEEGSEKSTVTEELSREELGRLVASRWTGEDPSLQAKDRGNDDFTEEKPDEKQDAVESHQHEEYDDYSTEDDEPEERNDEEYEETENKSEEEADENDGVNTESDRDYEVTNFSDMSTSSLSWWGKLWHHFKSIWSSIRLSKVPVDTSEAARVRKDYDDSSRRLSKVQSRISKLENKLKQDYGSEGEFYTFYDQCFEQKVNKYVYKVCPYNQASQVEGHSTTDLGRWDGFKDSYKFMQFSYGQKCWNGPDRSAKVRLRCGLRNELVDVDEPSRCEYVASLLTPVACVQERLQELENRLNALNKEIHDEL